MVVVSVILPIYNGIPLLQKSVESVLNQTFQDFEFIIINDGSTDCTLRYLETLQDKRIRVFSQENKGVAESLNFGMTKTHGEYLSWISHDNIFYPEAIDIMVKALKENPEVDFVFASHRTVGTHEEVISILPYVSPVGFLTKFRGLACFMWTKQISNAVGQFDISLRGIEDFDYWIRIIEQNPKYICIDHVLYDYTVGLPTSETTRNTEKDPLFFYNLQLRVYKNMEERNRFFDMNILYPFLCQKSTNTHLIACAYFDLAISMLCDSKPSVSDFFDQRIRDTFTKTYECDPRFPFRKEIEQYLHNPRSRYQKNNMQRIFHKFKKWRLTKPFYLIRQEYHNRLIL